MALPHTDDRWLPTADWKERTEGRWPRWHFAGGYIGPEFITDPDRMMADHRPCILIFETVLSDEMALSAGEAAPFDRLRPDRRC